MSKEVKQKKKSLNRSTRTGVNSKTRQKTNCTIKLQFTHMITGKVRSLELNRGIKRFKHS
jgi:hypothetical protein